MLQYKLIRLSSPALRFYRTALLLDMPHLLRLLPVQGRILDVGCGVGSVDYVLARKNPRLQIHGIDITPQSIEMAVQYHQLPNVTFACRKIEDTEGQFDCVLFIDVFHHVPPAYRDSILQAAARLLAPGGYVLIKDISRTGGWVSWAMDHYVSRFPKEEIFLENLEDLRPLVERHLRVERAEKKFRLPFPRYYLKATAQPAAR